VDRLFAIFIVIAGLTIVSISIDNSAKTTELIYFHMDGRTGSCPTICESFADVNPMYGTLITRKDCYLSEKIGGYCTVVIPEEVKPKIKHSEDYYNTLLRSCESFSKPEA